MGKEQYIDKRQKTEYGHKQTTVYKSGESQLVLNFILEFKYYL